MMQDDAVFPQLEPMLIELLHDIHQKVLPESEDMAYADEIPARGGVQKLATELLGYVTPEILDLQGRPITRDALQKIMRREDNDEDWNTPMGYLDFITDDRMWEWLRLYVGQCVNGLRRIVNSHIQIVLRGDYDSLHQFIVWLGNGHRTMNFIRLWKFPEYHHPENESEETTEREKSWRSMKMNFLEALFCKAFSTHHGILNRLPEDSREQAQYYKSDRRTFGLNLMAPLAQNGYVFSAKRGILLRPAEGSIDIQIRYWVRHERQRRSQIQREKKYLKANRPVFRTDFNQALKDALGSTELFDRSNFAFTYSSRCTSRK